MIPTLARGTLAAGALLLAGSAPALAGQKTVYSTYGVHNPPHYSNCQAPDCLYPRGPGEPSDPLYPLYWTSRWEMRVVTEGYEKNPPPYGKEMPAGTKYTTSVGATYYDSTWEGPSGTGAMMEYYEKKCLPIFPIDNNFTCSFISLGNTAYFVTYDQDRPPGMPKVCLFSELNHPPRRDFIKHLPYSKGDSERVPNIQGYSFWIDRGSGAVVQVGAAPDRTKDGMILFGYAFNSTYQDKPDPADPTGATYRYPQSFHFSGFPGYPPATGKKPAFPFAPIVSQNYLDFAPVKPDPVKTWDQVAGLDPKTLPRCQLFDPPPSASQVTGAKPAGLASGAPQPPPPTWGDIGNR